ncbi:MAG: aspartate/glutamate racemase family protein [Candidatus Saccharibacteria bacterium]
MSTIGILGGMGPQASAKLLTMLIDRSKFFTNKIIDDCPEIILISVPVPNFISNKNNIKTAQAMLIKRAKLLEKAGCNINCIACNTAHILLPAIQASTNVPFLSIPKLVAKIIKQSGFKKVGLLASPTTLAATIFDEALGWRYQINSTRY